MSLQESPQSGTIQSPKKRRKLREVITEANTERTTSIPFIEFHLETKKYCLSNQARKFFEGLSFQEFGVVCIAGKYRTGKSFLLNCLLSSDGNLESSRDKAGISHGSSENLAPAKEEASLKTQPIFEVGPTVQACTKGLWLSRRVLRATEGYPILVIDTEGLGALQGTSNEHDLKMFSLALLLSSLFVFNSHGTIDESSLENLSLVAGVADLIRAEQTSDFSAVVTTDRDPSELPRFLWLLRDFTLGLVSSTGVPISSGEYLETSLSSSSTEEPTRKKLRERLRGIFVERDCLTLVRPVTNESTLQDLSRVTLKSDLRPEFLRDLEILRKKILTWTPKKTLRSHLVSPRDYLRIVEGYVQALNQGVCPKIQDAWSLILETRIRETTRKSLEIYLQEISSSCYQTDNPLRLSVFLKEEEREFQFQVPNSVASNRFALPGFIPVSRCKLLKYLSGLRASSLQTYWFPFAQDFPPDCLRDKLSPVLDSIDQFLTQEQTRARTWSLTLRLTQSLERFWNGYQSSILDRTSSSSLLSESTHLRSQLNELLSRFFSDLTREPTDVTISFENRVQQVARSLLGFFEGSSLDTWYHWFQSDLVVAFEDYRKEWLSVTQTIPLVERPEVQLLVLSCLVAVGGSTEKLLETHRVALSEIERVFQEKLEGKNAELRDERRNLERLQALVRETECYQETKDNKRFEELEQKLESTLSLSARREELSQKLISELTTKVHVLQSETERQETKAQQELQDLHKERELLKHQVEELEKLTKSLEIPEKSPDELNTLERQSEFSEDNLEQTRALDRIYEIASQHLKSAFDEKERSLSECLKIQGSLERLRIENSQLSDLISQRTMEVSRLNEILRTNEERSHKERSEFLHQVRSIQEKRDSDNERFLGEKTRLLSEHMENSRVFLLKEQQLQLENATLSTSLSELRGLFTEQQGNLRVLREQLVEYQLNAARTQIEIKTLREQLREREKQISSLRQHQIWDYTTKITELPKTIGLFEQEKDLKKDF